MHTACDDEAAGKPPAAIAQQGSMSSLIGIGLKSAAFGVVAAALTLVVTFLIPVTFTARTTFLPPQQQQGGAAAALASLGALSGLVSGNQGLRTSGDLYVSLIESRTITDKLIDNFNLRSVYDEAYNVDTRRELVKRTRTTIGRKDGIISIEVDDRDSTRAAAMANAYIKELQALSSKLVLTEAQQRRTFFEKQVQQSRAQLRESQQALARSGVDVGSIKAEPKAAAESYSRLRGELAAAEIKLGALKLSLADSVPEIRQQILVVSTLRAELNRQEATKQEPAGAAYLSAYRDYKYQETLFELLSKQFELARVDESREGGQFQVIDTAVQPERKSHPKRGALSAAGGACGFVAALMYLLWRRRAAPTAGLPSGSPTSATVV